MEAVESTTELKDAVISSPIVKAEKDKTTYTPGKLSDNPQDQPLVEDFGVKAEAKQAASEENATEEEPVKITARLPRYPQMKQVWKSLMDCFQNRYGVECTADWKDDAVTPYYTITRGSTIVDEFPEGSPSAANKKLKDALGAIGIVVKEKQEIRDGKEVHTKSKEEKDARTMGQKIGDAKDAFVGK